MPRKRQRAAAPSTIPRPDPGIVNAIQEHLMTAYGMFRLPEVASRLLALVVELDKNKQPFPARRAIAARLGLSGPYGIDAAVNTALARGLITEEYGEVTLQEGGVHNRESVVRVRPKFYVPTKELRDIVATVAASTKVRRAA